MGLGSVNEIVEYFATVIPPHDNKFAALNSAVWSGGSFIYVPKGVKVEFPLQAYFRINAERMGQFERTLIICDEGADWQPDLADIRAKITPQTKAIVVINPNNPTGAVYEKAMLEGLIEIAREIGRGSAGRVSPLSYLPDSLEPKPLVPLGDLVGPCYLRFTALDRPGVLAHIAGVLGEHEIGIESVIQKGRAASAESVPVIVLTHPAPEAAVRAALARIDALPDVTAPTRLLRIEEGL